MDDQTFKRIIREIAINSIARRKGDDLRELIAMLPVKESMTEAERATAIANLQAIDTSADKILEQQINAALARLS